MGDVIPFRIKTKAEESLKSNELGNPDKQGYTETNPDNQKNNAVESDSGNEEKDPADQANPENKEKEAAPDNDATESNEDNERIEQLKKEVERTRKDYLEADYKKKKAYKRLGNFFGKLFQDKEEKNLENDEEMAWYQAHYENALLDHKNALLEKAKSKNVTDKELLDIAKIFQVESRLNLADVHDQVKIENQEGRFSGYIKTHSKEIVDCYNKLPMWKKLAIGAVFGLGAVGAGYIGGAAIGVALTAAQARRMFMGVVAGTGMAMGLEKMARGGREKEIEENTRNTENELKNLDAEGKFDRISYLIDQDIQNVDAKLGKIKNRNLINASSGVLAGTLVGSGLASDLLKGGWHHLMGSGASSAASEITSAVKPTDVSPENLTEGAKITGVAPEKLAGIGKPSVEAANVEKIKDTILTVKKGSSFEGTLKNYLNEHPDLVEKYRAMNGGRKFNSGQIAHRLALDYAKENGLEKGPYSLIHPDAKISINPAEMKVSSLEDAKGLGYFTEEGKPEIVHTGSAKPNIADIDKGKTGAADILKDKPSADSKIGAAAEKIQEASNDETGGGKPYWDNPARTRISYVLDTPGEEGGQIAEIKTRLLNEISKETGITEISKDIRMNLAAKSIDNWKSIKDLTFAQLKSQKDVNDEINNRLLGLHKKLADLMGSEIKSKKGETIAKWTERIARLISKEKINNFLM